MEKVRRRVDILTVADLAERYGVAKVTARRWCRLGYIEGARLVTGAWIIPKDSLEDFEPPEPGRPPKEETEE